MEKENDFAATIAAITKRLQGGIAEFRAAGDVLRRKAALASVHKALGDMAAVVETELRKGLGLEEGGGRR